MIYDIYSKDFNKYLKNNISYIVGNSHEVIDLTRVVKQFRIKGKLQKRAKIEKALETFKTLIACNKIEPKQKNKENKKG